MHPGFLQLRPYGAVNWEEHNDISSKCLEAHVRTYARNTIACFSCIFRQELP